ncbi:molybdate ABC transporter substrate-binding protein [Paludibacterium purpuratum]|uniref:Molybdate transport system substrate-binding protein n=1 Tax=Paludibacterium purpuratum TaxID=1144873 RepID=A0A4R7B145_9NEIS|nr:molybdate ABC transporter substrate-binding protein [Paludibacterium purpuratum]TDR73053.1 molybdate transport system substrate-binding protein [Paludibacterium purpuratum]
MKKTLLCTLLALLPLVASASPVKVAVAANMQYAFEDIAKAFTHDTGVAVQPSYSSSGKFATQVMAGAPFELFLSADNTFPQKLQAAGFAANAPKTYAIGTLVLWSLDSGFDGKNWHSWLKTASGKVAVANPQTAPYGTEAMHALNYYHLRDSVLPRLVTGDSIGQTAQFVASGAAQAGFVAKSQVVSAQMKGQGHWVELPQESHDPIVQDMVLLKPSTANPDAKRLFDYLQSPAARAILQSYGYRLP